ncbi:hypothetical protein L1281_001293 [Neisseria sp. HSC-16F19]|nr:hypothetical protein [Neisseria sp. HSC-16F19]
MQSFTCIRTHHCSNARTEKANSRCIIRSG